MTDKEIIKALENCCEDTSICPEECPYYKCKGGYITCFEKMQKDALDIINRQQAEIDKLKSDVFGMEFETAMHKAISESARAEAIKEFADELKKYSVEIVLGEKYKYKVVTHQGIDSIAERMVGAE